MDTFLITLAVIAMSRICFWLFIYFLVKNFINIEPRRKVYDK
jgi:hypothetical protein